MWKLRIVASCFVEAEFLIAGGSGGGGGDGRDDGGPQAQIHPSTFGMTRYQLYIGS